MTTIAWDGMTLAGDKQSLTGGGMPTKTTKVFKVKNKKGTYLVGFAGRLADGQAFVRFVESGFKEKPTINNLAAIVVSKSGNVTTYEETNANPCDMGVLSSWAIGSGQEYAMGAMAFGASAVEAILVATDLDSNTGLGVDKVSFS